MEIEVGSCWEIVTLKATAQVLSSKLLTEEALMLLLSKLLCNAAEVLLRKKNSFIMHISDGKTRKKPFFTAK